jgi:hypothetical protein
MSICRFSKAETSISGYILEAEPSQRYIIPVGHQPMTSHLVPEPSLDASTKRSEAAAAATATVLAPEVRQMERPEAREAPKQGSGPSPPREKSHSTPGLLGWPLGIGGRILSLWFASICCVHQHVTMSMELLFWLSIVL